MDQRTSRIVAITTNRYLTLHNLLKWDSVHASFDGEISHDPENIICAWSQD